MMAIPLGNVVNVHHGCDIDANNRGEKWSGAALENYTIVLIGDLTHSVRGSQHI